MQPEKETRWRIWLWGARRLKYPGRIFKRVRQAQRERRVLLKKVQWLLENHGNDQASLHAALQTLKQMGRKLDWFPKRLRKKWHNKLRDLGRNDASSLSPENQTLRLELMLQLGRDIMRFKDFQNLPLGAQINQLDPELVRYYLIYGSAGIRRRKFKREAFRALLSLADAAKLKRIIIEGKRRLAGVFTNDRVYYKAMQEILTHPDLPRQVLVALMPEMHAGRIGDAHKLNEILGKEKDPYLFWLLLVLLYRDPFRLNEYRPQEWNQYAVINDLIRTIRERQNFGKKTK